ncbi:hypothetical protein B0I26_11235 [Anoxybacillus vitaminiphilus]|uniref:RNA polymerase subunit sigma-70 n=1 Tax=Paranoxybacillus vitaminiphilus TaxID=581036 RepID=A0A327YBF2_9BACL|nr:hypothetical protein [Anoxybacillus vitaminiphilus]RAK17316.1 hypothetical protein B0I26_11235 [Anoxybacillus vitaminiphilus]
MRNSAKGEFAQARASELVHIDFHEFMKREADLTAFELASEFGLTLREVQKLKKQLYRS